MSNSDDLIFNTREAFPVRQAMDAETRLALVERAIEHISDSMTDIQASTKQIAQAVTAIERMEERHGETRRDLARLERVLEKHSEKLSKVDVALPQLIELRQLVMRGLVGGAGVVGMAVLGIVLTKA